MTFLNKDAVENVMDNNKKYYFKIWLKYGLLQMVF